MVFMCMWFLGKFYFDIFKCQDSNWYFLDFGFESLKMFMVLRIEKEKLFKNMYVFFKIKFYFLKDLF